MDRPSHARRRRSTRLPDYDYAQPGAYFVTVCTYERDCILGQVLHCEVLLTPAGQAVTECWNDLGNHYLHVETDRFVVMPNHVHGIVILRDHQGQPYPIADNVGAGLKPAPARRHPLSEIVRAFKTFTSRRINELRGTPRVPAWQRNYYERVIRNDKELDAIRQYIADNPVKWAEGSENPKNIHRK